MNRPTVTYEEARTKLEHLANYGRNVTTFSVAIQASMDRNGYDTREVNRLMRELRNALERSITNSIEWE